MCCDVYWALRPRARFGSASPHAPLVPDVLTRRSDQPWHSKPHPTHPHSTRQILRASLSRTTLLTRREPRNHLPYHCPTRIGAVTLFPTSRGDHSPAQNCLDPTHTPPHRPPKPQPTHHPHHGIDIPPADVLCPRLNARPRSSPTAAPGARLRRSNPTTC